MTSCILIFVFLLAVPLLTSAVPAEKLGFPVRQGGPPANTCSYTCYPGKGKAYKLCGRGRNANPNCYLDVCYTTNLAGKIHAGYRCAPYYVQPSYEPWPRYTPQPGITIAPVPDVPCPTTCRSSQTLAEDDCIYDGLPVAGCRSDTTCSLSTGSGFQCAAYAGVTDTKTFVSSLSGLELVVQYQWSFSQYDLDSATSFLGDKVGSTCTDYSGAYIEFRGDDTSEAGMETYIVRVGDARDASAWTSSTIVDLYAGWFASANSGSFTISASLRDSSTFAPVANSEISISTTTVSQNDCSPHLLGQVVITELADSVSLEIVPQ